MLERERFAVHPERDERVATVRRCVEREPARVAVDRPADHLVAPGLHAGVGEQFIEPDAEPAGVADQLAADRVRHTGERDVVLDDVALRTGRRS